MDNIVITCQNFYYTNTYLALAIVAGLALFVYFKPKAALKTLGAVLIFLLIIYFFSFLGKSSSIGMGNKKHMINHTLDKIE
ncbi:MAG: hypothetical protein KAS94_01150 [Desulfobulbaceae bacterium]|nr:hypothetical protein [Desulfobulbaceae bacterium]